MVNSMDMGIGHATSTLGTTWVNDVANPVLPKTSGTTAWDSYGAATPSVVRSDNGTLDMWYTGVKLDYDQLLALMAAQTITDIETALIAGVNVSIGHAVNTGSGWNKDVSNNPVFQKGSSGQ